MMFYLIARVYIGNAASYLAIPCFTLLNEINTVWLETIEENTAGACFANFKILFYISGS